MHNTVSIGGIVNDALAVNDRLMLVSIVLPEVGVLD
jgi:hypothetical protein